MKVFINPGHAPDGNPDPGAVNSETGLRECDVALIIGNKVANYLSAVGYDVKTLQSDSLSDIVDIANEWGTDVFVSIHCNSAANDSAKGTETWYNDGSIGAEKLATCILNQMVNSLLLVNRGVRDAVPGVSGLYVLKYTNMPAALIETAFISNQDDENLLADPEKQDQFASAIARGITDYAQ
jgi:N-acetylmuramoyl-L-alanine amidase